MLVNIDQSRYRLILGGEYPLMSYALKDGGYAKGTERVEVAFGRLHLGPDGIFAHVYVKGKSLGFDIFSYHVSNETHIIAFDIHPNRRLFRWTIAMPDDPGATKFLTGNWLPYQDYVESDLVKMSLLHNSANMPCVYELHEAADLYDIDKSYNALVKNVTDSVYGEFFNSLVDAIYKLITSENHGRRAFYLARIVARRRVSSKRWAIYQLLGKTLLEGFLSENMIINATLMALHLRWTRKYEYLKGTPRYEMITSNYIKRMDWKAPFSLPK